ncbi:gcn5-related n-acetyltransferase [Grosmannia clavigera kw1407]|uniref:Gcn5-related n-acetyltransferase n=1 Tax=Grosmannia clavigera (strain kw1407 / UAMH 11150) TaxID=655863 RepID=F0X7C9_GROCL|nr:gcn5-related n-acetyltransferase [Grosmannia clavigera kw1407]EFX06641.1 gcn5-related n-acetyltransferase [Grosmannia clavigera kw1407]
MDRIVTKFQPPLSIDNYDRLLPPERQPSSVSATFTACMEVRYAVFVIEQKVPADCELDEDDKRSCHWALFYPETGIEPPGRPVGTIRLVPYPQSSHPEPGGVYETVNGIYGLQGRRKPKNGGGDGETEFIPISTDTPEAAPFRTALHDGHEPYVKLGRMAVLPEYRRKGLASRLVKDALSWMQQNPGYFDPQGADNAGAPAFRGLVCVHAQVSAASFWLAAGFQIDDAMGRWWEEGMEHVGMFLRLDLAMR